MHPNTARALGRAEAAYGVDADHLARQILVRLLLDDAASLDDVHRAIGRGLARYAGLRRRLRAGLPAGQPAGPPRRPHASGEERGRSALAT
jgi:hypothetical protein